MKRDEALSFLREVLSESPYTEPQAVTLHQKKGSDKYAVNIRETFPSNTIKKVAHKRNLLVKENKDEIVVYKSTA